MEQVNGYSKTRAERKAERDAKRMGSADAGTPRDEQTV
jgi:hypothetical protein